ncbi:hypothetical protein D1O60_25110 [Escherichia coli]|nr:hypothetical protein [Escherichia coli]
MRKLHLVLLHRLQQAEITLMEYGAVMIIPLLVVIIHPFTYQEIMLILYLLPKMPKLSSPKRMG